MKKVLAFIAIIALVFSITPAFAQVPEPVVNDDPTLQSYGSSTVEKLTKGFGNIAFGWTQPFQDARNNDGEKGAIQVWVEGAGNGLIRTAVGVAEVITAPVPSVDWEGDAEWTVN